jgi:hypothetical protein
MIRISSGFPSNVVAIACEGRVTRKDYDDVLVPAVTAALQRHEKGRLFYEITPQFSSMVSVVRVIETTVRRGSGSSVW